MGRDTTFEKAAAAAARTFQGVKVAQREDSVEFTGDLREGGRAVGFTAPGIRIANPNQLMVALSEAYPPELRKAGIGGLVQLRLFVNEQGSVTSSAVSESNDRPGLDAAALAVTTSMRFTRRAEPAGWPYR